MISVQAALWACRTAIVLCRFSTATLKSSLKRACRSLLLATGIRRVTSHFNTAGGVWPPHCIQGSKGAEFHPDLKVSNDAVVLSKGTAADEDSYSAFAAADSRGAGAERSSDGKAESNGFMSADWPPIIASKKLCSMASCRDFRLCCSKTQSAASISNPKILLKPLTLWSKPGLRSHLLWTVFVLNEIVIALSNRCSVPIGLAGCPVPKTDLGSRWFSDS